MQQKIISIGVNEFQPSFKSINQKTPYYPKNFKTNKVTKDLIYSNHKLKAELINNSDNLNSKNNLQEENINLNENNLQRTNNNLESYNNSDNSYHIGRWTEEEHQKFIDGILEYGNEWKKVQQIIKTRSSTQARSHAQKFFLRVKKIIKNNEGNFSINEKDKIFGIIINNILPNKKVESLTKNQKEKLLSAIFSNIKYEGELNERSDDDCQLGLLEEENLNFWKNSSENDLNLKHQKNSLDAENLNANKGIISQRKASIGQKRKLSRVDSRDKIFFIKKDISHKASMDFPLPKESNQENKDKTNEINLSDNNDFNQNNKNNECSKKYFHLNSVNNPYNSNQTSNNFINSNNENNENKGNIMNNCIINNYINITNNYMNNKYICNICNNDILNNNNYIHDFYNYERNDSINKDKNINYIGSYQYSDKALYNPIFYGNQYNIYNNFNSNNNKINNYNENENLNNGANPFELNFNSFTNENYNNNENESQLSMQEGDFVKLNNNNIEDNNNDYN